MGDMKERRLMALRQAVIDRINDDHSFPAFPATIQKLNSVMVRQECSLGEVASIVETDPGLTARCLKLANSAAFAGAERIQNIRTAVMRLGIREIRRMTFSVGLVSSFSHLKVQVDWTEYWLHSVLTARLTELLTGAYQAVTGKEYLAGLIHDIGKLLVEHYFPQEFASMVLVRNRTDDHAELERRTVGITHADVCVLIAERWNLDVDIVHAVKHHHMPEKAVSRISTALPHQRVLAVCLALANSLANRVAENIGRREQAGGLDLEALPEWSLLQTFTPLSDIEFNLDAEVMKARETLSILPKSQAATA
jgi:putative nucleotidyltransferase with HDIG domain